MRYIHFKKFSPKSLRRLSKLFPRKLSILNNNYRTKSAVHYIKAILPVRQDGDRETDNVCQGQKWH
jgi:hypothetical protein